MIAPPMRVAVLTTSYPRGPGDAAGHFVGAAVERLRARGLEVDVVSPATFRHYGIAYGSGIVGNLRAQPWRAASLPLFLAGFRRAAARAARGADLVHAHWLGSGAVAATLGKPFVLQVWGTDVEVARRAPALARVILERARLVIAASRALADKAAELGARETLVIPSGIDLREPGAEEHPPHILYAGRLSEEKGVLELVEAARGLDLVVAGDGPLRDRVPSALGFVPNDRLQELYARAAVVACPSHREGFGYACLEAMAHGKPVVASAVGGLLDLVVDGETGIFVPPRDPPALREALETLLADRALRERFGKAARRRARERFSWDDVTDATLLAYRDVLRNSVSRAR
jgi:glycosyltransferase involved in cell wall biosynthesis